MVRVEKITEKEQPNSKQSKRSQFGSGLNERLGGEGKIQWKTSKPTKTSLASKLNTFAPFILAIILSCLAEFALSSGSSTLILGLVLAVLYSIRARPHDNIPQGDGYVPFLGHSLNVAQHWHDFFDEETRQCLKLPPSRAYYSTSIPLNKHFVFIIDPNLIDLLFRLKFGDADKGHEVRSCLEPMFG